MKVIWALFLFIFSVSLIFAQDMNPEAAKFYNEGNQKLKEGNASAAVEAYNKALDIQKDYRILYQRGIAFRKLNKLNEAYSDLMTVTELKPDFDLAYNALGTVEFTRGNYDESVKYFQKTLEVTKNAQLKAQVEKNISLAYTKIADSHIKNFDFDKAIENLNKALQYQPKNDAAYLALARSYVEKGKFEEAIASADNALKFRSSIPKGGIYYYKGLALKFLGRINEAKLAFEEGKKDPTYRQVCDYELKNLPKQ